MASEAIEGANPFGARSFPMSFTAASAATAAALKPGGYSLYATQDCWIKLGTSAPTAAAIAPTTTQPSPNDSIRVRAGIVYPLTIPAAGAFLAVVRDTADGVLDVNGPWQIPG